MTHSIRFYFDFISPYAYFAAVQLEPWRQKLSIDVEISYTPILFAALLNHWEHKGPAEIPPKRLFTYKDSVRQAHSLGLSLKFPPSHPFNPLLALRLATVLEGHPRQHELILDIYHAAWKDGLDITDASVLKERLVNQQVDNADELLAKCGDPAIKQTLQQQTESAMAHGVFGVPSFQIDDEIFWGSTQFSYIENYLLGKDPVQSISQNIADHPVGASRK